MINCIPLLFSPIHIYKWWLCPVLELALSCYSSNEWDDQSYSLLWIISFILIFELIRVHWFYNYSHQVLLPHNVPGLFSRKHSVKDFVLNSLNKSGKCVYICVIAYCKLCIHSQWSTLTKEQIRQIYLIASPLLLLLLWDNLNALKKFHLWTLFCWWLFKKKSWRELSAKTSIHLNRAAAKCFKGEGVFIP